MSKWLCNRKGTAYVNMDNVHKVIYEKTPEGHMITAIIYFPDHEDRKCTYLECFDCEENAITYMHDMMKYL